MRMRHRSRAMTLIEVLIAAVLLVLLQAIIMALVVTASNLYASSESRVSNAEYLNTTLWRMLLEMRDTNVSLVTSNTQSTPVAFSFLSAYNPNARFVTDPSGSATFQKYVIYYLPNGKTTLLRKEVIGQFSGPMPLSDMLAQCDGQGTVVCPVVSQMSLVPSPSDNSAVVTLTCQSTGSNGKTDKQTISLTVHMRQ